MESQEVFKIYRDSSCYFTITTYPGAIRKSSHLCGAWAGFVDQFPKGDSIEEIKNSAISWLKNKLKGEFDNQYTSEKSYKWLLKELEQSNQLSLIL